jgi:hypothetical protein
MASKFGGIPVEEEKQSGSKFGGLPVEDEAPKPQPVDAKPKTHGPFGWFPVRDGGNVTEKDYDSGFPEPSMEAGLPGHPGQDIVGGFKDIGAGNYSKGVNQLARGAGKIGSVGLPAAAPAMLAAPLTTIGGLGSGMLLNKIGESAAAAFGASPDQAELTGNLMSLPFAALGREAVRKLGNSVAKGLAYLPTTAALKQYGADPKLAMLRETSAVRPEKVQQQIAERISQINPVMEAHVAQAPPVPRAAGLAPIQSAMETAKKRGVEDTYRQLAPLADRLIRNPITGEAYPEMIPARQALDIKRGSGDLASFKPMDKTSSANEALKSSYGAQARAIHEASPEAAALDDRLHSLLAAQPGAKRAALGPDAVEKGADFFTRPTGALTGFLHNPLIGAAQQALGVPSVRNLLARAIYRGVGGEKLGVPEMPSFSPKGLLAPPERVFNMGAGPDSSYVRGVGLAPHEAVAAERKLLPPSSAPFSSSGVVVPDILGKSARGEGNGGVRMIEGPKDGVSAIAPVRGRGTSPAATSREIQGNDPRNWFALPQQQSAVGTKVVVPRGREVINSPTINKAQPVALPDWVKEILKK